MRRSEAAIALAIALASPARADPPPPAVVGLLLDTSGSIKAGDLLTAQALVDGLLKALPAGSELAVFTFDDQSRLVVPRTRDPEVVRRALAKARIAGQWTTLNDALYDASRYLKDAPAGRRAIVLVTDGQDENSVLNLEDALGVASAARIPVFAVGIGTPREKTLRRIAKLTAGAYFPGGSARGEEIASAIAALPVAATPAAVAPEKAVGTAPTAPASGAAPGRRGAYAGLGLLLLLALLLALGRKRKPRCPRCGRELPNPLAECPFCADEPQGRQPEGLPETVFQKLDGTEEFLEKTITLRDSHVLAIVQGAGAGEVYSLSPESATSVGRAKANDIVLPDVAISSQHCRIRKEEGHFVVHDLRSTNGTFVNDRRVSRCALAEGDTIKVGETLLQFRTDQRRM